MKYSSKQIVANHDRLIDIVNQYFDGEESQNILNLFKHFEERLIDTPASSRPNRHNCFVGGFLDHTLRVIDTALDIKQQFIKLEVDVTSSDKDIVMASMFHDLGKLGDLDNPFYIPQTDEWRRKKLQEWYTFNDKLEPMDVADRALWILQTFNIKVTQEVWKAIKMSDGMFDEGNQKIYRRADINRNILHYIVHFADWLSTVAEKQHYFQSLDEGINSPLTLNHDNSKQSQTNTNKLNTDDKTLNQLKDKFNELFN
mgnify:CR=1 FL=1|jgi:hypothetical protein|tara:strand:- start:1446 stop:2213 length:768 start_codon:yes stop_codon:yes gene_type:complete